MSDRTDNNNDLIKNEDTLIRRAWVDRAVASVRRHLERNADRPAKPRRSRPRLVLIRGRKESQEEGQRETRLADPLDEQCDGLQDG